MVGRDPVAVLAARVAGAASRRFGWGGTALPGLVAEAASPGITARLGAELAGCALISGTNGKTTTARLLGHIVESTGRRVCANASGANLAQAITAALVADARLAGSLRRPDPVGVFEVDEAALATVAAAVPNPLLVLTNVFRDQLDRFGETDTLVQRWRALLADPRQDLSIVFCADDPRLAELATGRAGAHLSFGLAGMPSRRSAATVTSDTVRCPRCGAALSGRPVVGLYLEDWSCPTCGLERPAPWLRFRIVATRDVDGQTIGFRWPDATHEAVVDLSLPGLGNAYNAAAAVTAAVGLGIEPERAIAALSRATNAFGRFERLEVDRREVVLTLLKNPASLDELARTAAGATFDAVVFAVNDASADGQDVSWYWDAAPDAIVDGRRFVVCGRRAADFAVRLRYALVNHPMAKTPGDLGVLLDPAEGLARAIAATPAGGRILVAATYTALLGLRAGLVDRGLAAAMPR